jgi:hypothetical protein
MKKLKKWMRGIIDAIINPKRRFTKIVADGNIDDAMLRAFIYGLLGGVLVFVLRAVFGGGLITVGGIFNALIITPVMAVALLFVFGGILMMISEITGGERDWEIAIKGLGSVFFVYPLMLGLNFAAFNCTSLWIISVIIDAYILFLLYNIARYAMHAKHSHVLIVISVLALFLITVYATDYRSGWLMIKNAAAMTHCI